MNNFYKFYNINIFTIYSNWMAHLIYFINKNFNRIRAMESTNNNKQRYYIKM